jgi:hypothetical protein
MGVVNLDTDRWRSANVDQAEAAKPAKAAKVEAQGGGLPQQSQLSQLPKLAEPLRNGLLRLRNMPAPAVTRPEVWVRLS